MISKKSIEEVLEIARVDEIIGETVDLKRRGSNLIGLCPFHGEKTPSFIVSPAKNIYKCFGCGKGGRPLDFLMEYHQMSFVEAIQHLAQKYNVVLEETILTKEQKDWIDERESYYLINEFAAKYYFKQAQDTDFGRSIALGYFKSRGISEEMVEKFQLGFAPADGSSFVNSAILQGFDLAKLKELGLVNKSNKDFFVNRIVFPIRNFSGKVVGFAGRILEKSTTKPKYINSVESIIYNKREILYGAYDAKQSIRKQDQCILVEGYTDTIGLHQFGISHVVATSGTSLTEDHVKLIKRQTQNILFLFDGDKAGLQAAKRGIEKIISEDVNVRVALLPENEDPDSFIRKCGPEDFQDYLDQHSQDFLLFISDLLIKEHKNDPIGKSEALREILLLLSKLKDPLKRILYTQEIAKLFDTTAESLTREVNKLLHKNALKESLEKPSNLDKSNLVVVGKPTGEDIAQCKDEDQERDLCRILMLFGDQFMDEEQTLKVGNFILQNISDVLEYFENKLYQTIVNQYAEGMVSGLTMDSKYWLHHEEDTIRQLFISFSASPYYYSPMWESRWQIHLYSQVLPEENFKNDTLQSLMRFKIKKINRLIEINQEKIKSLEKGESYDSEVTALLEVDQILKKSRNVIAKKMNSVIL
jgi:DNA primase